MTKGKIKSTRNKTIDFSAEEGTEYLNRCIRVNSSVAEADILDKTIIGDTLEVVKFFPDNFVDLHKFGKKAPSFQAAEMNCH